MRQQGMPNPRSQSGAENANRKKYSDDDSNPQVGKRGPSTA